jgi:predicted phage gp36 major capsid-like protein
MEKNILSQVIEAEKEIQRRLDAEKAEVQKWLEGEKKAAAEELEREEEIIRGALRQTAGQADLEAEAKAAEIEDKAKSASDHLGRVRPEVLTALVGKQIGRILPV